MVDPPTRYFVFEISDPIDESQSRVTQNIEEAQQAYERGFFVAINEVVQSFLSTKQKVTTIITTDWTERTNL
jgi:hypothetical protein